jgi:alpha-tubulin suppressor-like RCC1 family protein
VSLVAVTALAVACADATPASSDGTSPDGEPVAPRGSKLTTENGLRENGLRENGLRENGLRENGLRENGMASAAFKTWFDKDRARAANVMQYVAKCALRPDQSLAYTDGGGKSYQWPGALGLAPGWNARAATVAEQEWVSACLMAFTNKCGNNVIISLRAPTEGAPETERFPLEAGEASGWRYQEAAFFGNLFDPAGPDANGCDGSGTNNFVQVGLGRECGSDPKNCGHKAQGLCSAKCTISTNADKYYKSCTANGRTYSRVITTYLDPSTWRGAMDCRNKDLEDNQISIGQFHVCARKSSGQLACWGRNDVGQLGDGTQVDRFSPVTPSLLKVVQVSVAEKSTCARFEDGTTKCWGLNNAGQLGDGTIANSLVPKTVVGLTNTLFSTSGQRHYCALEYGGALYCWGANFAGQIGNGVTSVSVHTPTRVGTLTNVVETVVNDFFSCARMTDNTVQCWGDNSAGQLGDGTTVDHYSPAPVKNLSNVTQLTLSDDTACARLADGTVRCWGSGYQGQFGDGTILRDSLTPVAPSGLGTNVTKVVAGYYHVCALKSTGRVFCWGFNEKGQLGNGSYTTQALPVQVSGITDAVDIAANFGVTCARRATGALLCWGANEHGQLGLGAADNNPHPNPTQVPGL